MGVGAKTKGYIKVVETGQIKKFQYNPSDFTDGQIFNYNILSSPCSNYPKFHYVGSGERTFSISLFIRGTKGEPQNYLDFFENLRAKGRFDMPKLVIFAFGNYVKKCIITEIDRQFTDFNEDLSPREVTISLSLTEV